jgi:adenine-specific DNA-methyltransferase
MRRRWIGVEVGEHASTHCLPRLKRVVDGEQGGISELVSWSGGGGFRFARLGDSIFADEGRLNPDVRFGALAAHLWFAHTHAPSASAKLDSPLLGVHGDVAIALLYNGILGDRRPEGGNVLTHSVWERLRALRPDHAGRWLIFGEASRLGAATLKRFGIEFRQIPYELGIR